MIVDNCSIIIIVIVVVIVIIIVVIDGNIVDIIVYSK